jgi:hypothetical protein
MAFYKVPMSGSYSDLERARSVFQEHHLAVSLLPSKPPPETRRRRGSHDNDVAACEIEVITLVVTIAGTLANIVGAIATIKAKCPAVEVGEPESGDPPPKKKASVRRNDQH